jgi:CRP-like cAMP-binding protein
MLQLASVLEGYAVEVGRRRFGRRRRELRSQVRWQKNAHGDRSQGFPQSNPRALVPCFCRIFFSEPVRWRTLQGLKKFRLKRIRGGSSVVQRHDVSAIALIGSPMSRSELAGRNDTPNRILASLPAADFELLQANFVSVQLRVPKQLETANKQIDLIYFMETGFASVVANGSDQPTEVGLIGCEGMTGLAVLMGHDRSPNETYIQHAGKALRIPVSHLRQAIGQSVALHRALLRYGYEFHMQVAQTAFANCRGTLAERLARWLLMAHDRVDGDELTLTHEFVSIMLGVRRASVTDILRTLVHNHIIALKRRTITILDRKKLRASSNGFYVGGDSTSP